MVTRIVKLHFRDDKVQDFLEFFDTINQVVNNFPGCYGMKLYQDVKDPAIVMTYSHWENEEALNNYRDSDAFGQIWPNIKPWFQFKPEAWTVSAYFNGFEEKKSN